MRAQPVELLSAGEELVEILIDDEKRWFGLFLLDWCGGWEIAFAREVWCAWRGSRSGCFNT